MPMNELKNPFIPMNEQDYLELERIQRERKAKSRFAHKACKELVASFSGVTPESSHPQYSAYNLAMQALSKDTQK